MKKEDKIKGLETSIRTWKTWIAELEEEIKMLKSLK